MREKARRTWHKDCKQSSMRVRHKLTMSFLRALLLMQPAGTALAQEIPFQLREGLIWMQVDVPQSSEPLNFLLDTGAGVSVLNSHTADRIGLKGGRPVSVQGVGASTVGHWP